MKLSGLGGEQCPVQPVPVPVQTTKLASVFGSVISIGALRSAPLIMIFEVSAFANNSAGIASRRRMTITESSRFTVHPTYYSKLDHRRLGRSIHWTVAVEIRQFHSEPLRPGIVRVNGIFRQSSLRACDSTGSYLVSPAVYQPTNQIEPSQDE
jgi:hypothetical protein